MTFTGCGAMSLDLVPVTLSLIVEGPLIEGLPPTALLVPVSRIVAS